MIIKNDKPSKGIISDEEYKNLKKNQGVSAKKIMFGEKKDDSKVIFKEASLKAEKKEVRKMVIEDPSSIDAVFFRCLDPYIEFTKPIIIDVYLYYFYNNVIGIKFVTKSLKPQETKRVQVILHDSGVDFMDGDHINNFTDAILLSIVKEYCENNLMNLINKRKG